MIDRRVLTHFDWVTFLIVALLAVVGYATIYSATFAHLQSIYKKDLYWILIGFGCLLTAVIVNYSFLEQFGYAIWGASVTLLVMVMLIGHSTAGARRWINLGFISLQPSELAKLALIVALAKYYSDRPIPARGLTLRDLLAPGVLLIIPALFIVKQPDLGTAIILWMIFWTMALTVKISTRTLIGICVTFAGMVPLGWRFLKGYQKARLMAFLYPDRDTLGSGYHVMQSKIAIGSGGLTGKGFMQGTQGKLMFLPEHHTDFIFAVLAEEWGLIGSFIVLALFISLIISGLNTANNAKDRFGFLLALGVTSMFFWHAIINLGMVSGILPVVGVPLPFISYGGSFLITCMIGAGLLINVMMRRFMF